MAFSTRAAPKIIHYRIFPHRDRSGFGDQRLASACDLAAVLTARQRRLHDEAERVRIVSAGRAVLPCRPVAAPLPLVRRGFPLNI